MGCSDRMGYTRAYQAQEGSDIRKAPGYCVQEFVAMKGAGYDGIGWAAGQCVHASSA